MGLINFRRSMLGSKNSGYEVIDHFAGVSKIDIDDYPKLFPSNGETEV